MGFFGNGTQIAEMQQQLVALQAQVKAIQYSKAVMLPRLQGTPSSFGEGLDEIVSDTETCGMRTSFTVGKDVMRVVVDAAADTVTLTPVRHQGEPGCNHVVIKLNNEPLGDFSATTAGQIRDTYRLFRDGPQPTGADLAPRFNQHLAPTASA